MHLFIAPMSKMKKKKVNQEGVHEKEINRKKINKHHEKKLKEKNKCEDKIIQKNQKDVIIKVKEPKQAKAKNEKKKEKEAKDTKENVEGKDKKEKKEGKNTEENVEGKNKKEKKKKKEKEGVARTISMNSNNATKLFSFETENTNEEKHILQTKDRSLENIQEKERTKKKNHSNQIEKESTEITKDKESTDTSENLTPLDFEKLIVSKKNSSVVWISYIAYFIEKKDLEQARNIAERALKTIDIHETNEKLNIYLCYLNMECAYGDKLDDIFKRALLVNDEKVVYLHLIRILKDNNKLMHLKEICEQCVRKFRHSKKVWKAYLEILHGTFKDEEMAHEILLKALHSLPKRKHLHMIITAARLEYKYSSKERGKSYFERLIAEYPKRSDIWFTYLDIHINTLVKESDSKERKKLNKHELEFIRNIFERFSSIKFKPRVMKMIFTKWLSFEKSQGSKYYEQLVQKKAHDYVESLNVEE